MIKEIENFFPIEIQNSLLEKVSCPTFPWYYVSVPNLEEYPYIKALCENDSNINLKPGFQHTFYRRNEKTCDTYINNINLLDLLTEHTEKNFNVKVRTPLRVLGLLSVPVENFGEDSYLLPHVDFFMEHKTCLYYINNSDGDTFLFKEKCMIRNVNNIKDPGLLLEKDNNIEQKTLQSRVSPAQGKAILFNGLNYHSGSMPRQNTRYVLNFNFK